MKELIFFLDSAYTTLGEDGMKLYKQLMSRRLPETVTALTTKAKQLEPKVIQKLSVKQRTKLEGRYSSDN